MVLPAEYKTRCGALSRVYPIAIHRASASSSRGPVRDKQRFNVCRRRPCRQRSKQMMYTHGGRLLRL